MQEDVPVHPTNDSNESSVASSQVLQCLLKVRRQRRREFLVSLSRRQTKAKKVGMNKLSGKKSRFDSVSGITDDRIADS
jgi:hypothetical protein